MMESFIKKWPSGKNVIITHYKDDCYMVNSAYWKDDNKEAIKPIVSFMVFRDNLMVEWCPPYGPISIDRKCEEGDEYAREHYLFGHAQNDWTQCGVDDNCLNEKAIDDIDGIFSVLLSYLNGE